MIAQPTREQLDSFAADMRVLAYSRHPLRPWAQELDRRLAALDPGDRDTPRAIASEAGDMLAQVWPAIAVTVAGASPLGVVLGLGAADARPAGIARDLYDTLTGVHRDQGSPDGSVAAWLDAAPAQAACVIVGCLATFVRLGAEAEAEIEATRAEWRRPPAVTARRGPFYAQPRR